MSDRRAVLGRLAPLLLLLALAGAVLPGVEGGLRLANVDTSAAEGVTDAFDGLADDPTVIVGFDPDLGTYAEIRTTVRALIADMLARDATLAFVSLTPEGRALAIAELERLGRFEANPRQIIDLGFVPGAEAALVRLARSFGPEPVGGLLPGLPGEEELSEIGMAVVVGGNDLGPRSWVEQVAPRTDGIEIVAVAPTVLLPQLAPYLASGQLAALLGTPLDGAAYRASLELGPLERLVDARAEPAPLAVLVGLLVAVAVLGQSVGARALGSLRAPRSREPA